LFIFSPALLFNMSTSSKVIFGIALMLYGGFRCYRLIKKENSEYYEDNE